MVKNYNEVLHAHAAMETECLILRKHRIEDAADVLEMGSDAQTLENLLWEGCFTIEDANATIYDSYWATPGTWAIVLKDGGKVIGAISLRLDHDCDKAKFGYVINRHYWGKGYATEALKALLALCFEHLHLNRVESNHFDGNEVSGRVMQKADMKPEGRRAQSEKVKGILRDNIHYGITKSDYFAHTCL